MAEDIRPEGAFEILPIIVMWLGEAIVVMLMASVLGVILLPLATRRFTDSWGATAAEVSAKLPGDDVFPATREISTKAITIPAPAETVYALIQQMGQNRAGWYGWDWFYNMTGSSGFVDGHYSKRIVPDLQNVRVGDRIDINDIVSYEVLQADPVSAFVMVAGSLSSEELASGELPDTWAENTMAWVLTPTDDGRTRLVLRMRADGSETGFARWVWNRPLNFGGALFSHKTMVGIKRVAKKLAT